MKVGRVEMKGNRAAKSPWKRADTIRIQRPWSMVHTWERGWGHQLFSSSVWFVGSLPKSHRIDMCISIKHSTKLSSSSLLLIKKFLAEQWWLTPVILVTQEAEIRRIVV
jgi:hypothetical protein